MTRRGRIYIRGAGFAGLTAGKLLLDRGAEVRIAPSPRRQNRILAVPIETLRLAADLFNIDLADLQVGTIVHERRVDWSAEGPNTVGQTALVCDGLDLAAVLARPLERAGVIRDGQPDEDADWIIEASGSPARGEAGGERVGCFARIADLVETATSITASEDGWLFTSPHPRGGLAALIVAPSATEAPATADAIADRLARAGRTVPTHAVAEISRPEPIAPRLCASLHAADRLIVGEAALALDPLRGDGTGFALRGALLAQAVLAAIEAGHARARCIAHYETRMRSIFVSHLRGCCAHYRAARHAAIWGRDIMAMDRLAHRFDRGEETFEFRLEGFDLVPWPMTNRAAARER